MRELLSEDDFRNYIAALEKPPLRFARKNMLKEVPNELIASELGGYPLLPESAKPGKCALHAAGAYYVQEPAAAKVAGLLPPLLPKGALVLDMCAAPGGKVTAAATARPDCLFVANEPIFSRTKILLSNVERMGLRNVTVTYLYAHEMSKYGGGLFDAVIADVPCSGEGMYRKTEFHDADLGDASVAACTERAASILDECDVCLRGGGLLSFSTCTFNRSENEQQIMRLINEKGYTPLPLATIPHGARRGYGIDEAIRFFPQDGGGEGHFACILRKPDGGDKKSPRPYKPDLSHSAERKRAETLKILAGVTKEVFTPECLSVDISGCELLPRDYPFAQIPALRRGVKLTDIDGGRTALHHHFATAANPDLLTDPLALDLGDKMLSAYLAGETFELDGDGYKVVTVCGITLGLIKVANGTAKNHYPKGLRFFYPV